jgi:progressive ankylosis protein
MGQPKESTTSPEHLTQGKIFRFWTPLAATWLMMAVEGPLLAAIIARLPDPKYNLAAYGVAFSLALIVEAPIIMMMSASTALAKDRHSYLKLRNFLQGLNIGITILMLILLIPSVFTFIIQDLVGLPPEVAELTHLAVLLLLPWPGAIGYRRFYQGILIRNNQTKRVAYGTVVRIITIFAVSFYLFYFTDIPGAAVGGITLSTAVILEAIASRFMAAGAIRKVLAIGSEQSSAPSRLSYKYISGFYFPLAVTSVLALGVHPMVTFFVGQSRMALESLAVLPVLGSLVFVFRSMGLSYHEVGIALMGERFEGYRDLRKFAFMLGGIVVIALGLIAFTPLSHIWFISVSGLTPELAQIALVPVMIMVLMPGLSVMLSFQRAILVNARKTAAITYATGIEVTIIILVLFSSIHLFDAIGAVAAALGFITGRIVANLYLAYPAAKARRQMEKQPLQEAA